MTIRHVFSSVHINTTTGLLPSPASDVVNIVAKKIRTNENVSILTPESRKITVVRRRSCRGGPARLQRGRRGSATSAPLHSNGHAVATPRGRYGSEKATFLARKSRFSASKSCTNREFAAQPSRHQSVTLARAILRYLRPMTGLFQKNGKMKAFRGLF